MNESLEEIKGLYSKLKNLSYHKNDPLNSILDTVKTYIDTKDR